MELELDESREYLPVASRVVTRTAALHAILEKGGQRSAVDSLLLAYVKALRGPAPQVIIYLFLESRL
jgi:hypothetical protein